MLHQSVYHGIFTEVEHRLELMYRIAFEVLVNNLVSTFRSCYEVWLPFNSSWSVWKMFLRKLVTPKVFTWYKIQDTRYFRTRGGGRVWSTVGGSLENRLRSVIRWWAVCTAFSWQLQVGEGVLLVLWRYERKLPWFVRNCVRMKLGQRGRGSLWKMVGMNSLVWDAFAEFMYVAFQIFM